VYIESLFTRTKSVAEAEFKATPTQIDESSATADAFVKKPTESTRTKSPAVIEDFARKDTRDT
jgi:hypothetical protein